MLVTKRSPTTSAATPSTSTVTGGTAPDNRPPIVTLADATVLPGIGDVTSSPKPVPWRITRTSRAASIVPVTIRRAVTTIVLYPTETGTATANRFPTVETAVPFTSTR